MTLASAHTLTAQSQVEAPGSSPPRSRRADVQGLRAVAILLVVAFHAGLPLPGGFTGVDVFFAISGFVITGMLADELQLSSRIDFVAFYVRRVKRLLPALALMVAVIAPAAILLGPAASQRSGAATGAAAAVFSANAYLYTQAVGYFDPSASLNPFLHTWTLGVEEQFYVAFPLLLLVGWWVGRRLLGQSFGRRGAAAVVGCVSAASFVLSLETSGGRLARGFSSPARFAFYSSPTRAWEFGAGALVALAVPWLRRLSSRVGIAIGVLGGAAIVAGAVSIHDTARIPGTVVLLPVCGACALLAAGSLSSRGVSHYLGTRPGVWIGNLSYSWYLWHWPLIVFAKAVWPGTWVAAALAGLLALLPAWLSYRLVENPIRFDLRLTRRRVAALVLACIVIPISASAALLRAHNALVNRGTMVSWRRSQLLHADVVNGCDSPTPLDQRTGTACTWAVRGARGTVVLLGDSNAGQFTEPIVQAARRAHLNATVATFSACPFVDLGVIGTIAGEARCRRFNTRTLAELVRRRPSLVVIADRSDDYIEDPTTALRDDTGRVRHDPGRRARLWERSLGSTLTKLNRARIPVVVVRPIPSFAQAPQDCAVVRILLESCGGSTARSTVDDRLRRSVDTERRAVASAPISWTVSFENAICSRDGCSADRGDAILYRNTDHLSVDGALTLTGRFYRTISAHAARRPRAS